MKTFTHYIQITTKHEREIVNINGDFDGKRRKRVVVKVVGE
jgi:hypothetical protein